jgi:D-alanine-D-alanine ligase
VRLKVAILYNDPVPDRYQAMGESLAEMGVMDEVHAVEQALNELNYPFFLVPLSPPLHEVRNKISSIKADVIFNLFEGFDGRPETEGQVAEILSKSGIPFTGCPPSVLAAALDKSETKKLFKSAGIPTPGYQILSSENIGTFHLDFPCIVKPLAEDASHGISEDSVVNEFKALERQVTQICNLFGGRAMVEEYVDGREFNTTVMGDGRLTIPGISEIVYTLPPDKPRILTFQAKWEENSLYFDNTRAVCPALISPQEHRKISKIAKAAFRLVGCRGYARVDFRQDKFGNFKVLEINPNPDITPGSGAALQAVSSGMTYSEFINKIIHFALKQQGEK